MEKKLTHASSVKPGSYILIDGNACIVKDTQTSRPGKHGHAKVRIVAIDLITGQRREIVKPGHDNVEVPIIQKRNAQILSIDNGIIMMMDNESFENIEAELELADENVRDKLQPGQTVLYWNIMGKIIIKQIKSEAEE